MTHKTSVALKFFRKYMQLKGIFLPIEQIISYCKYLKDEIKTRYVSFAEHLSFKHPRNWVSKLTNLLQELFKCFWQWCFLQSRAEAPGRKVLCICVTSWVRENLLFSSFCKSSTAPNTFPYARKVNVAEIPLNHWQRKWIQTLTPVTLWDLLSSLDVV